jgi:hypothetical protein
VEQRLWAGTLHRGDSPETRICHPPAYLDNHDLGSNRAPALNANTHNCLSTKRKFDNEPASSKQVKRDTMPQEDHMDDDL